MRSGASTITQQAARNLLMTSGERSERTWRRKMREAVLAVTLPEKPGSYKKFLSLIGSRNITEFNYRFNNQKEAGR